MLDLDVSVKTPVVARQNARERRLVIFCVDAVARQTPTPVHIKGYLLSKHNGR